MDNSSVNGGQPRAASPEPAWTPAAQVGRQTDPAIGVICLARPGGGETPSAVIWGSTAVAAAVALTVTVALGLRGLKRAD